MMADEAITLWSRPLSIPRLFAVYWFVYNSIVYVLYIVCVGINGAGCSLSEQVARDKAIREKRVTVYGTFGFARSLSLTTTLRTIYAMMLI